MSYIHKTFSKEIVKRAKLRYRFFKDRMGENIIKKSCFTFVQNEKRMLWKY